MVRTCFHISNRLWIRCDAYTKYILIIGLGTENILIRELVKTTILQQDPPLGQKGGSQRHHLSSNITNDILLAFKFELTQEYSASKESELNDKQKK